MRRLLTLSLVMLAPAVARGGGFELQEQSARGTAMSGAQTALADDPAAIYYNPAGMTFQRGWGGLVGVNVINASTQVNPPGLPQANSNFTTGQPFGYGVQRLGPHFAIGFGLVSNFAQHFNYPGNFSGRFLGSFIDITTATANFAVAIRPIPRLSVGFGLDIVPASVDLYRALSFGSAEGTVHFGATAVGVGGNVGVLAVLVPRYLILGASYRSTVDLDYSGKASINGPPELAPLIAGVRNGNTTLTLPHNFSFALATHPAHDLSIDVDVHLTLWHELDQLTLTISDPKAPPGTQPQKQTIVLNWSDAVGIRVGGEYRVLDGRLAMRLGGGYDFTPVPASTITPLTPDANRILVSVGLGWQQHGLSADVGYLAAILLQRTGTNPDFPNASYQSVGHVIGINLGLRLEEMFGRLNDPSYKH